MKKLFTILAMVLATIIISSCSEDSPVQPAPDTAFTLTYKNTNSSLVYIHIWTYDENNEVVGVRSIFKSNPKSVFQQLMTFPTGYTLHIGLTFRDDRTMDEMLFNSLFRVKLTDKVQNYYIE